MQDVRWRRQKTITWAAGSKSSEPLARGYVYRDIFLNLRGAITCTAANNTAAKTMIGDEWGIIKRIDIMANASDVIRSFTGEQLWWINYFLYGNRPKVCTQLGDYLFNGAGTGTANPSFNSTLCIPFWSPGTAKPFMTCLDSSALSDLRIEITWGTWTDINSSASAMTTTPTLEISSNESAGITGPFTLSRMFQIVQNIAATNSEARIDIPVGPQYRGFIINIKDTTNATDTPWNYPTDTAGVKNFQLVSGTTIFFDLSEPVVNQMPLLRRAMPFQQIFGYNKSAVAVNIGPATNIVTSQMAWQDAPARVAAKSDQNAWYFLDLLGDGWLTEAIDTYRFTELYLKLNCAGAVTANVIPLQLVPTRT